MDKVYKMNIAGLDRELPLCPASDKMDIGAFIMFSDVELTVACARELLKIAPDFDVILTAESKGIPLAYEMARQSNKNYILARKGAKLYMKNPIKVVVKSITTTNVQNLFIDENDMNKMNGKKVLIVDDVISTGESLHALEVLVSNTTAMVAGKMAVLAEGDAADRKDIKYLEKLPLFFHD